MNLSVLNIFLTDFIMFNTSNASCCYIEMYYCCRSDPASEAMDLPSSLPFYLIPRTSTCPDVRNTNSTMEVVEFLFDSRLNDIRKIAFGAHPHVTLSVSPLNSVMRYFLCYYEPAVKNTTVLRLQLRVTHQKINANFPSNIAIILLYNGSFIGYGAFSSISYNIRVMANCSSFSTERLVKSVKGVGFYNGSFYPSSKCKGAVDMTVVVHGVVPTLGVASGQVNLTMFSRTNVLIVLRDKDLKNKASLITDLKQLKEELEGDTRKKLRDIRFEVLSYRSPSEVRRKLKNVKVDSISDPRQLHGLVGINIPDVQDVLNSFSRARDILFITGGTGLEKIPNRSKTTLMYDLTQESPISRGLVKMVDLNVNRLIIIRSKDLGIPISLASYLLRKPIVIVADVIIPEEESSGEVAQKLRKHWYSLKRTNDTYIYFIVDALSASKLFIAAARERVSPKYGNKWISGSENGVFERGVGSKECYMLRPFSCSEEFRGVWMIEGFQPIRPQGTFVDGEEEKIDFVTLKNKKNYLHSALLRAMVLDGAGAIASGIVKLSEDNLTITTASVLPLVRGMMPASLPNFRFFTETVLSNKSANCLSGWNGTTCSQPLCLDYRCTSKRGRCAGNRLCECYPGFYGHDCAGICHATCQNGVCNEGALGDGTCIKCDWLYEGKYCQTGAVLRALITGCVGSVLLVITVACYISKFCRLRHGALQNWDLDETQLIIQWTELENCQKVDSDKTVAEGQLSGKVRYTDYFKATFHQQNVFVTCLKKTPVKLSLEVRMEIRKIKQLDHINIEKVLAVCLGPPYVALVTELANMGSLYDILHAENVEVPLEIKFAFMEDISRGMLFLHEKCSMSHGRLKSTNCLLHKGWRLKLTDLGLGSLRRSIDDESHCYGHNNQKSENEKQAIHVDYNSK